MSRRWYWPLAILATVAHLGCRDPMSAALPNPQFRVDRSGPPVLQQSPTAPALERYQASFWLAKGKEAAFAVRYQPIDGAETGWPFMQLDVPKDGLLAGAGGTVLKRGDSVLVTVTIDTASFAVSFEPSGVLFSSRSPATLTFWYDHANLDLNGNGVVDGNDWQTLQRLTLWYAATPSSGYKLSSKNDTSQLVVSAALYHFSSYVVSW